MSKFIDFSRRAAGSIQSVLGRAAAVPSIIVGFGLRRAKIFFAVVGCVCLALAVAGAALIWIQANNRAVDRAEAEAKVAAEKAAVSLLSYDYRENQADADRRATLLTGRFKDEYQTLMRDSVMPAAVKAQVSTKATVASTGTIRAGDSDKVSFLLFLNQTTQSSSAPQPMVTGSRVRVSLERVDQRWLVSELTPV